MYCRNCGKKLPDNARFCDRCNQSVRKKEGKMDIIEELKEERLARKKAQAIEERLKKIKKIRRKRYKIAALAVLAIALVWGMIFGGSYFYNRKDDALKDAGEQLQETAVPTEKAPSVTDIPEDNGGYISATAANIEFVYPDLFSVTEVSESCIASFGDSDGQVTLIVDKRLTSMDPVTLMDQYKNGIQNAKVGDGESQASDEGYTITVTSGTMKYHKKSIVKDGAEMYYELKYPADKAEEYEQYTRYMDSHFKVS